MAASIGKSVLLGNGVEHVSSTLAEAHEAIGLLALDFGQCCFSTRLMGPEPEDVLPSQNRQSRPI